MAEFNIQNMILFLVSARLITDVYLLCNKCCLQVIHANGAQHFLCDVKVLIQELYCLDIKMFIMIIVNGTMFIFVWFNCLYPEASLVLKFFLYSVCLNLCPVVQRCIGIILFLIVFYQ